MHQKGYSMLEIIVAMIIVVILASLAIPSSRSIIGNSRLTSSANDLLEAFALARSEAVKRKVEFEVAPFDGDWRKGWTVRNVADGEVIQRYESIPESVEVTGAMHSTQIIYEPSGARGGEPGELILELCTPGVSGRTLHLSKSGHAEIRRTDSRCMEEGPV